MNPYPSDDPAAPPAAPPPVPPPGAGAPPGYVPHPGYYAYPPPRTNQNALIALIVALVGLFTCPLIGLVGIYFGNRARAEIRATGEQGEGMAQAGQIIGWIGLALSIMIALFVLAWFGAIFTSFFAAFSSP